MGIEKINPQAISAGAKQGFKAQTVGSSFGSFLDAAGAMGGAAMTASQMYGSPNSATVLSAAFSGMSAAAGAVGGGGGGGTPYMAAGFGAGDFKAQVGYGGQTLNDPMISGTSDAMSKMDMVNTMNQNNLQLLELQAVMQNNMQGWNTKSNILSADHRARMAMIEKFTAR